MWIMEKCTRLVAVPSREPDDLVARIAKLEHLAQSAQELQQTQTASIVGSCGLEVAATRAITELLFKHLEKAIGTCKAGCVTFNHRGTHHTNRQEIYCAATPSQPRVIIMPEVGF